ncbi:MAG: hypothetical protein IPH78_01820 [Bacteroidetes bacterium]|nr:hypothetical protein [Bacteroidota bacterium]MBK8660036.1 hypothetical protein [Bacteroidota bacterium]
MVSNLLKIILPVSILFFVMGCENKSCTDVVCGANQTCNSGNCFCVDGFEGTDCNTQSYLKYIGNYNVSENCFNQVSNFGNYTAFITQGTTYNTIYINNLFGQGIQAGAIIRTDQSNQGNYLEIPQQSQGALTFSGQGTFNQSLNRMTLQLNYNFNFGSYQCEHTFYKQ